MSDLEKVLKDVVHGGIGAVATVIEAGSGLAKAFVEKGQEITADLKQAAEEACEACKADPGVDVRSLTPQQRATLRRQLDELDAEEAAQAEAADGGEAPEVTYTTGDESAPAEDDAEEDDHP